MKKKFAIMKLMTVAMSLAVVVAFEGRSAFWTIGEPQLPEKFKK